MELKALSSGRDRGSHPPLSNRLFNKAIKSGTQNVNNKRKSFDTSNNNATGKLRYTHTITYYSIDLYVYYLSVPFIPLYYTYTIQMNRNQPYLGP